MAPCGGGASVGPPFRQATGHFHATTQAATPASGSRGRGTRSPDGTPLRAGQLRHLSKVFAGQDRSRCRSPGHPDVVASDRHRAPAVLLSGPPPSIIPSATRSPVERQDRVHRLFKAGLLASGGRMGTMVGGSCLSASPFVAAKPGLRCSEEQRHEAVNDCEVGCGDRCGGWLRPRRPARDRRWGRAVRLERGRAPVGHE